jgi:hypothetical protein
VPRLPLEEGQRHDFPEGGVFGHLPRGTQVSRFPGPRFRQRKELALQVGRRGADRPDTECGSVLDMTHLRL